MAKCRVAGVDPCPHDPPHGSYSTYSNHGCRCDPCREANRAYRKRNRARACVDLHDVCPHEIEHGKVTSYVHHGCRCELCTEARNAYQRALHRRRKQKAATARGRRKLDIPHGTPWGRQLWGCPCRPCRVASAVYNRERYVRFRDGGGSSEEGQGDRE